MMSVHTEICNAFNSSAPTYEQHAKVQAEIGARLLERLDYLAIEPRYVLDIGCGVGYLSTQLKTYYPKATVIAVDIAYQMLQVAEEQHQSQQGMYWINADMLSLPFPDGMFDLVFSNQALHWAPSFPTVFNEINRVMRQDACLMFSTLGPSSLYELQLAFRAADQYAHTLDFVDMHDIGDQLMSSHFLDPVMDMETIAVHYHSLNDLLRSLRGQGVRNVNSKRSPGLTGRQTWKAFERQYETFRTAEAQFPLTYEVIYGHAWKGSQKNGVDGIVETFISVDQLRSKRFF